MASILNQQLNFTERRTFRLHLSYSILEGITLGILALNEFVFVRSIKGSNYQLSVLFQLSTILMIFGIFFLEILKRVKNKKKLLRIVAIVTRLPLALLLFFPTDPNVYITTPLFHYFFLGIFLLYYFADPLIYPSINQLLKNNYKHEHFGRLYGLATTWNKIIMMVVTFLYGFLLDYNIYSFRYIFPITSILGIVSIYLLTRIRFQDQPESNNIKKLSVALKESTSGMFRVLKNNKAYNHFEVGFMLYGFAYLTTTSVIILFFSKELQLNYTSVAFYKNSYNILAILLLPLFGRLIGRIDPRRFAALTFLSIMLFLIFLVLTEYFPYYSWVANIKLYYVLIFYILSYGVYAATMSLLWSIGSAYFCKNEDADTYQAIHVTLTGGRAIFAPILGILFYNLFGFAVTFLIGAALLAAAIIVMFWSLKNDKNKTLINED